MGLMCLCNTGITCTCTCTSECMYFSAFIHHNLIVHLHVHVCTVEVTIKFLFCLRLCSVQWY